MAKRKEALPEWSGWGAGCCCVEPKKICAYTSSRISALVGKQGFLQFSPQNINFIGDVYDDDFTQRSSSSFSFIGLGSQNGNCVLLANGVTVFNGSATSAATPNPYGDIPSHLAPEHGIKHGIVNSPDMVVFCDDYTPDPIVISTGRHPSSINTKFYGYYYDPYIHESYRIVYFHRGNRHTASDGWVSNGTGRGLALYGYSGGAALVWDGDTVMGGVPYTSPAIYGDYALVPMDGSGIPSAIYYRGTKAGEANIKDCYWSNKLDRSLFLTNGDVYIGGNKQENMQGMRVRAYNVGNKYAGGQVAYSTSSSVNNWNNISLWYAGSSVKLPIVLYMGEQAIGNYYSFVTSPTETYGGMIPDDAVRVIYYRGEEIYRIPASTTNGYLDSRLVDTVDPETCLLRDGVNFAYIYKGNVICDGAGSVVSGGGDAVAIISGNHLAIYCQGKKLYDRQHDIVTSLGWGNAEGRLYVQADDLLLIHDQEWGLCRHKINAIGLAA